MPNQQVQPSAGTPPAPVTITPALLKTHSITPDEYTRIEATLGRTPSLTELGIFSVMWSEHCSYKSSRVHLRRLPTKSELVVQGPGENAGIIDVGDGWACAFKIESHNHPSYIEPYQGAATGVGGILRDIFTMGARPLAVMDSLRFGPLVPPEPRDQGSGIRDQTDQKDSGRLIPGPWSLLPAPVPSIDYARNRQTMQGVVAGVAGYGNCFGVPNLGGETRFEDCYSGNPLLNAFALGLVRMDEIFYAKATGVGNPVFYVGAKTGRDGIHGATMASEEFTEGSEQKRPNVQMGDPFLEKLLLEACLEAMKTGAVLGIQDMGAAGLTCSTCEMGARGELGVSIELDLVPQRETGMNSYEIMLSESQERMLLVAEKGREHEVIAVFQKWGLDCAEVGVVTADDVMRVRHHGELVAEIPNKALTDDAPLYHRPVGTWKAPVPLDPPEWVLEELKKPRDYTADLKKLLASANICDKRYIFEQYDSMVQTNTVQGPGGEAGVMRIKRQGSGIRDQGSASPADFVNAAALAAPASGLDAVAVDHSILGKLTSLVAGSTPEGEATFLTGNEDAANPVLAPDATHKSAATAGVAIGAGAPSIAPYAMGGSSSEAAQKPERGLAMALAGNGRWCYLNPKLGAMHAVAEAARKVACTGAKPVAATNCLNFGNPEKPEIMAQLSQAIDGIAEACIALGTPITGGNVSLYNETRGEGIYPTPVIGVVGIIEDVTKAVPSGFAKAGDHIVVAYPSGGTHSDTVALGSTEFSKTCLGSLWGSPPAFDLAQAADCNLMLRALSEARLVHSVSDVGSGGIAVALARACAPNSLGVQVDRWTEIGNGSLLESLFAEPSGVVLISCSAENENAVRHLVSLSTRSTYDTKPLGKVTEGHFQISFDRNVVIDASIASLGHAFSRSLKSQLAEEVFA